MSDYNKTDIGSGHNTSSAVNTELGKIETAVNSKVDKSGSTMTGQLDMNSNRIINAADAINPKDVPTYGQLLNFNPGNTASGTFREYDTMALAVADVANITVGDTIFLKERTSGRGGMSFWKAVDATIVTENESDIVTGNAVVSFQVIPKEEMEIEVFGAIGDGTTDDTSAIEDAETYAAANGIFPVYRNRTYIFDTKLTLTKIKANDATLKLKDSATVTGSISDELIEFTTGAVIKGSKLTVDCNKASNAPSPPTIGTVPGIGILFSGGSHRFNHIRVINSWNGAVNHFTGNIGSVANTVGSILEADSCGGGIFLDAGNSPAYINQIKVTNINSEYTNAWSHSLDVFHWKGGFVREILIDGCDGTSDAISAFFSGLTTKGNENLKINQIIIKNMVDNNPSDLVPLAWSNLSSKYCTFENVHISKFSENRHIEWTGDQGSTLRNFSIIADFNESYTSGATPANTHGIIITDDYVDNFNDGRDHGASNGSVFENGYMENMGFGIKDGGLGNTFKNIKVYGSLTHGYICQFVNENSDSYAPLANPIYGGARIINCEFCYSNQSGIAIAENASSRPEDMNIVHTKVIGNGKDSTATAANRTGIRHDVTPENLGHKIVDCMGDEDASSLALTDLWSAEEGASYSDTSTFTLGKLDGAHNLRAGMRFNINCGTGASSIEVRVEHASGASDTVQVRPTAVGSGTIQNGNTSTLTGGSTFAGTVGTRRITCTGGALRTEIIGKAFVTINGTLYRVAGVVDNNTLDVEELIGSTFSGASGSLHRSTSTATTALQQDAVHGSQMDIRGLTFSGNASATPTDQLTVGVKEIQSINVGATSSAVVTLNETYPEIPFALASSNATVAGTFSVARTSKTQLTVYNGAAFAANFTVKAEY